jgi:hypothetical protein
MQTAAAASTAAHLLLRPLLWSLCRVLRHVDDLVLLHILLEGIDGQAHLNAQMQRQNFVKRNEVECSMLMTSWFSTFFLKASMVRHTCTCPRVIHDAGRGAREPEDSIHIRKAAAANAGGFASCHNASTLEFCCATQRPTA